MYLMILQYVPPFKSYNKEFPLHKNYKRSTCTSKVYKFYSFLKYTTRYYAHVYIKML